MANSHLDIKDVAHLARLRLTLDEEAHLGAQLDQILGFVEELNRVDVSGVEPTAHAFPLANVTRPDKVCSSIAHDDAMKNAPAKANGLFMVPKIVE